MTSRHSQTLVLEERRRKGKVSVSFFPMSLSFVSKSIQTATEDGGFDETPIAGAQDVDGVAGGGGDHRPLFEQLRSNREKYDAEHEEQQQSLMRGTLALDEEDAAHLIALQRQAARDEALRDQETSQEVAAFRAARAERAVAAQPTTIKNEWNDEGDDASPSVGKFPVTRRPIAPPIPLQPPLNASLPIVVKRKRRRTADGTGGGSDATPSLETPDGKPPPNDRSNETTKGEKAANTADTVPKQESSTVPSQPDRPPAGIGGLLAGYDSSSSDGD